MLVTFVEESTGFYWKIFCNGVTSWYSNVDISVL